jgi:hypothetical protein
MPPKKRTTAKKGKGWLQDHIFRVPSGLPKMVKAWADSRGNDVVGGLLVARYPLQKAGIDIKKLGSMASTQIKRETANRNIDKLFHLFMIVYLVDTAGKIRRYVLEKNQRVNVYEAKKGFLGKNANWTNVALPKKRPITLNEFLDRQAKAGGDDHWVYNVGNSNCQDFVRDALRGNKLITPFLEKFTHQTVDSILPRWVKSPITAVTDLAAWLDYKWKGGIYKKSGGMCSIAHPVIMTKRKGEGSNGVMKGGLLFAQQGLASTLRGWLPQSFEKLLLTNKRSAKFNPKEWKRWVISDWEEFRKRRPVIGEPRFAGIPGMKMLLNRVGSGPGSTSPLGFFLSAMVHGNDLSTRLLASQSTLAMNWGMNKGFDGNPSVEDQVATEIIRWALFFVFLYWTGDSPSKEDLSSLSSMVAATERELSNLQGERSAWAMSAAPSGDWFTMTYE